MFLSSADKVDRYFGRFLKGKGMCTSRILTTLPTALTQLHRRSIHCQGRIELLPLVADVALKQYRLYNRNIGNEGS